MTIYQWLSLFGVPTLFVAVVGYLVKLTCSRYLSRVRCIYAVNVGIYLTFVCMKCSRYCNCCCI